MSILQVVVKSEISYCFYRTDDWSVRIKFSFCVKASSSDLLLFTKGRSN